MKIQELEYIKKDMQNLYDAMDEKNPYDISYRHQLEEIIGRLTFVIKNETGKLEMDAETAEVFKIITKNFEVRVSDS